MNSCHKKKKTRTSSFLTRVCNSSYRTESSLMLYFATFLDFQGFSSSSKPWLHSSICKTSWQSQSSKFSSSSRQLWPLELSSSLLLDLPGSESLLHGVEGKTHLVTLSNYFLLFMFIVNLWLMQKVQLSKNLKNKNTAILSCMFLSTWFWFLDFTHCGTLDMPRFTFPSLPV